MLRRLFAALTGKRHSKGNEADFYPIVGQRRRDQTRGVSDEWPVEETSGSTMPVSESPALGRAWFDPPRAAGPWTPGTPDRISSQALRASARCEGPADETSEETVFFPASSAPRSVRSEPSERPRWATSDREPHPKTFEPQEEPTVFITAARRPADASNPGSDDEATRLPEWRGRPRRSLF